jgi:hypothetical protein
MDENTDQHSKCNRLSIMAVFADGTSAFCDITEPAAVTINVEEDYGGDAHLTSDNYLLPAKVNMIICATLGDQPAKFMPCPVPPDQREEPIATAE